MTRHIDITKTASIVKLIVPTFVFIVLAWATSSATAQTKALRVVIKPLAPFVMKQGTDYQGFSIDLWNEIAKRNGWHTDYVWRETVADLLDTVKTGGAEVGIAGISVTKDRDEQFDFSLPIFNSGLQIMTPEQASFSVMDFLGTVFNAGLLRVLGVIALIVIAAGHVIWLIERRRDPDYPKAYLRGVWEGIWWAGVSVAKADFGERRPMSFFGRLSALIWVFSGIILIANFTAATTTSLTLQQIHGNINGVADLPGKRVMTVENTTAAHYLDDQHISYTSVKNIDDAYAALEQRQADAVVYDAPVLLYYANSAGRGKVRVIGSIFKAEFYGIALPNGSPLRKNIDRALLDITADGTYHTLYTRWFGDTSQ